MGIYNIGVRALVHVAVVADDNKFIHDAFIIVVLNVLNKVIQQLKFLKDGLLQVILFPQFSNCKLELW